MSEKIQVKVFISGKVNTVDYVPVFQSWIRDHVLDELLVDVVDYSHVFEGPEVTLIGHEGDYVLDRNGGRLGLLYAHKRGAAKRGNPWLVAFERVRRAQSLLESPKGAPSIDFDSSGLQIRIADRLGAPNSEDTFGRIEPELRDALTQVYGRKTFALERAPDTRGLFAVNVRFGQGALSLS